jgi:hypothetical protein
MHVGRCADTCILNHPFHEYVTGQEKAATGNLSKTPAITEGERNATFITTGVCP